MIYWIRRIARIIAFCGFFVIFFCGISLDDPFNTQTATIAFLKAFCGGVLLWFTGFVISDIILKGALEDIQVEELEPLEGGIIQRVQETKTESRVLDGPEKELPPKKEKKTKKKKDKVVEESGT